MYIDLEFYTLEEGVVNLPSILTSRHREYSPMMTTLMHACSNSLLHEINEHFKLALSFQSPP